MHHGRFRWFTQSDGRNIMSVSHPDSQSVRQSVVSQSVSQSFCTLSQSVSNLRQSVSPLSQSCPVIQSVQSLKSVSQSISQSVSQSIQPIQPIQHTHVNAYVMVFIIVRALSVWILQSRLTSCDLFSLSCCVVLFCFRFFLLVVFICKNIFCFNK